MAKKYRLGIIGFGHMHINNVAALYGDHPQVEWVACADTTPARPELRVAPYTRDWNKEHLMKTLNIPRAYDCYKEMLQKEKFDIIIVTSENARHPDIVEACAAAGVHTCVEKPMAMNLQDALRMVRACKAHNTTMIVNWPLTWSPGARKAKELIDEGVIGRVIEVKWRAGHTGPLGPGAHHAGVSDTAAPMTGPERAATWWHQEDAGGGAMLDYCCYGAMVSRWYIGEPGVSAVGMKANLDSHWGDANDNAAMIVRFPNAMALLEGSWTTWSHGVPTGPIVYGTTGTLVVETRDGRPIVRLERGGGEDSVIYEAEPLPEGRTNVAEELIYHLETGEPLHPSLEMMFNLEVMAILDAGLRSATSGKQETVDNASWCIG
ncbi:MAG TPA: Gfo/Idh/MocA family oxidoreductase [Chloroflexi bacterium]|jgi:predicted dehydrogenase|nr:Gfo/Idh/MocA family oxidoreductase [Chloroflexota bacterium]